ncbi:MAG: disulfide bond formation protein DsbD, partial [Pseudomonadota bacterium]|nr:disulfide bond formation protein DsbD [Pseudomonadota bacterium]
MKEVSGDIMRSVTSLLLSAILWLAAAGAAGAASGDWNRNDHVEMRLISAVSGVGELKEISAGLHFRMQPGWKLYWRTPGDAGFPPLANWS